jgi:hypothetical protein
MMVMVIWMVVAYNDEADMSAKTDDAENVVVDELKIMMLVVVEILMVKTTQGGITRKFGKTTTMAMAM